MMKITIQVKENSIASSSVPSPVSLTSLFLNQNASILKSKRYLILGGLNISGGHSFSIQLHYWFIIQAVKTKQ